MPYLNKITRKVSDTRSSIDDIIVEWFYFHGTSNTRMSHKFFPGNIEAQFTKIFFISNRYDTLRSELFFSRRLTLVKNLSTGIIPTIR